MTDTYLYEELGFGPIRLQGGVDRVETPWGPATSYERIEELHRAIALSLSRSAFPINGKALRFLRQTLGYTQLQVGAMEGYQDGQMVGQWEKGTRLIPDSVIANLRLKVRSHLDPQAPLFAAMDDIKRPASELSFNFRNGSWIASNSPSGGWAKIQELVCSSPLSVGLSHPNMEYNGSPEPLAA